MKMFVRKNIIKIMLAAYLLSFIALSITSEYKIKNVKTINSDIALMLTPYGITNNLVLTPDHYLRPYYYSKAQKRLDLSSSTLVPFLLVVVTNITLLGLLFGRKKYDI